MTAVHVLPLRDLIEHIVPGGLDRHEGDAGTWLVLEATDDPTEPCPCVPATELVTGDPLRPDGWIHVHHSLDGRELTEP